jgi:nitrate reductase NapAB chaperone NapD
MSVGAYLLARFSDPEKMLPAVQTLEHLNPVTRWHAVDGHVHLVIKAGAADRSLYDHLSKLDGIDQVTRYQITQDGENAVVLDPSMAHAYVFIETEPAETDNVRASLQKLDEVVFCSSTSGGCDIVAVVKGANFDAVNRTVLEKLRALDGVVRLKHDLIISLNQL